MKKTLAALAASAALLLALTACGTNTEVNTNPEKPKAEVSEEAAPAPAEVGTRENPAPLGTEVSSDEWKVTINTVNFNAAADPAFKKANEYIDLSDLPATDQFVLVNATYTYIGDDAEGSMPATVNIEIVTADGVTQPYDVIALTPDAGAQMTTLYNGGTLTASTVLTIPTDKIDGAVLAVSPGLFADTAFIATK